MTRQKYRISVLVLITFILLLAMFFCRKEDGNIRESHDMQGLPDFSVDFSAESGFYDSAFDLTLSSADDCRIFYTLDCSEPDEGAMLYTSPVRITDASEKDNLYSTKADISYCYYPDYFEKTKNQEFAYIPYHIPLEKIDKAVVVKAVAVDGHNNKSEVVTKVYWIGYKDRADRYRNTDIVSVVTDPEDLFDKEKGIYVLGEHAQRTYEKYGVADTGSENYQKNADQKEIAANITILNQNYEFLNSDSVRLRIQGGWSRRFPQKSFNILPLNPEEGDGYTLTACGHNQYTMLNNYLINTVCSDLSFSVRSYKPCSLFLDGEYWGIYWRTERYKAEYINRHFDVPCENIIIVKNGELEVGNKEDIYVYKDMCMFFESADMTEHSNYLKACELIDISSFIDYYATEIYIANYDWPHNNIALWRSRTADEGSYSDGKWRYMIFDVDWAMELSHAEDDMILWTSERDKVFAGLMKNEQFASLLYQRLVWLAENKFDPVQMDEFISRYELDFASPMENEYKRYYGDEIDQAFFVEKCEDAKAFFRQRYNYIMQNYRR